MELDRRQLLGGIGVAAAGAAAAGVAGAVAPGKAKAEDAATTGHVTYAQFNEAMRSTLRLDSNLVGVKFLESADDAPEGAVSPKRDLGKHIATCQGFSMARYNGQTVVMTKEDEWCWAPLVGYGQVDCSEGTDSFDTVVSCLMIEDMQAAARFYADEYPRFELDKYKAWVIAPLSTMDFEPDVVLVWGDPYKINWLCLIAKRLEATTIVSNFDGIDSCVYEMVNTMSRDSYQVCFPDCGEGCAPAPCRPTPPSASRPPSCRPLWTARAAGASRASATTSRPSTSTRWTTPAPPSTTRSSTCGVSTPGSSGRCRPTTGSRRARGPARGSRTCCAPARRCC